MNKKYCTLAAILTFLAGLLTAFLFYSLLGKDGNDWLSTTIESNNLGVSYTTKAIFGSDIPLSDIKEITGKTKFLEHSGNNTSLQLGFLVTVIVDKLDKSKVPQKYLKQKPVVIEGQEFTQSPIDEVLYEVELRFTLIDKDGFELLKVASKPHTIYSGKKNELQGIVQELIPIDIVKRISQVQLNTHVTKCITCD